MIVTVPCESRMQLECWRETREPWRWVVTATRGGAGAVAWILRLDYADLEAVMRALPQAEPNGAPRALRVGNTDVLFENPRAWRRFEETLTRAVSGEQQEFPF